MNSDGRGREAGDRWVRMESHLAHLEKQFDELNRVVVEQSRQLERLRQEVARWREAAEAAEWERIRLNNPKPPHFSI